MGHDTLAYRTSNTKDVVIQLRRSAFDNLNKTIYQVLGVQSFYGGVSGLGEEKVFNKKDILEALELLGDNEYFERERVFLKGCLEYLDSSDNIHMYFI